MTSHSSGPTPGIPVTCHQVVAVSQQTGDSYTKMKDWSNTLNILVSGLHKRKARNAVLVTLLLVFVLSQAVIYTNYMQV